MTDRLKTVRVRVIMLVCMGCGCIRCKGGISHTGDKAEAEADAKARAIFDDGWYVDDHEVFCAECVRVP